MFANVKRNSGQLKRYYDNGLWFILFSERFLNQVVSNRLERADRGAFEVGKHQVIVRLI